MTGVRGMTHPILSFDFGPQGHLCFSIETRPEWARLTSPLEGWQFELIYIAADERDVVRLRTNFKSEDLYLYRLPLMAACRRCGRWSRSLQEGTDYSTLGFPESWRPLPPGNYKPNQPEL